MARKERYVVGLDVGTSAVVCVVGESLDDLFRTFAEDIGLDMAQFDADYNDPSTLERIRRDQADGRALGVESTPTFFLDGERLQPESFEELVAALEAAAS